MAGEIENVEAARDGAPRRAVLLRVAHQQQIAVAANFAEHRPVQLQVSDAALHALLLCLGANKGGSGSIQRGAIGCVQFILADAGQPVVQPRIVVLRPDDFDTTAYRRCRFADAVAFVDLGAGDYARGWFGGDAVDGIGAGGSAATSCR